MSNRSWFYASNGQQQGPYPEAQLRDLVTRGTIGADTLVWTEGMSGWQRAGDIPGLVAGGSAPPSVPQPGGPAPVAAGGYAGGSYAGGALSLDIGLWDLLWPRKQSPLPTGLRAVTRGGRACHAPLLVMRTAPLSPSVMATWVVPRCLRLTATSRASAAERIGR
jgi:hypothetical protein